MRRTTVTLGGQNYEVTEMRSRDNAAWRKKVENVVEHVAGLISDAPDVKLTDGNAVARLVRDVAGGLVKSPDTLREMLLEYSPALSGDRERIEAEAYDSEIIDAFWCVLELAFPFGGLLDRAKVAIGQAVQATGRN